MIITAIRHTTVDVPSGMCYGITDVPLASTFRNELEPIRKILNGQAFDAVFYSPSSRCTCLATEIFPVGLLRIDQRLTELNFGDWEMMPWNTIFKSPEGKVWFADYAQSLCPGGESFTDLIERGKSFLNDLRSSNFLNTAVFTHAGMIRALMCLLQQKTPEQAFYTPLEYGQIINFNFERK